MDLRERKGSSLVRHPWERARLELVWRLLQQVPAVRGTAPVAVLDAGAGDAWVASELAHRLPAGSRTTCLDAHYTEEIIAELAVTRPPSLRYATALDEQRFDLVLALDVVEHVDDDLGFVRSLAAAAPGGWVLVTVPAWQRLFGPHDVALGHFRRYSPRQLRRVLTDAGLEVVADGQLFQSLLVARSLQLALQRRRGPAPEVGEDEFIAWSHGERSARAIAAVLAGEGQLATRLALAGLAVPGLSCWAVCRVP